MAEIEFDKAQRELLLNKLRKYCSDELDVELGQFDADFLLDFIGKEIGAFYYNQGLYDANALFGSKMELLSEAIYELEKPTT